MERDVQLYQTVPVAVPSIFFSLVANYLHHVFFKKKDS